MSKPIIALVDGSSYSRSVCENAAWIAGRLRANVDLLHVLGRRETPTALDLSGSIALGARSALLEELSAMDERRARLTRQRARAILDDAEAVLREAGVNDITARLRHGDLLEEVERAEASAEMIVIGKRGEAADFATLHLGSNLERIVRAASRPVFVTARAFRPISRVLIAYDGGPSAMKAVEHVARSPLFAELNINLLTVGSDNDRSRQRLQDAQAMLKAGGHDAGIQLLPGQPEEIIFEAVERQGIDALVMGAYGHSRVRSLIIGSTTAEMVRSCKIPVIMFR